MLKSFNDLIISDNMDEVNVAPETMSSFFIAFYCEKGTLQFSIEGEMYHAKKGDLVACTPRNIIGLYMRSPDLQGKVICMGESLYDETMLSAVCKEKSGRTAMDWITESTVAHIKYYLLQTDLTVKEIAFKLDFPDVSFFCKYVKKHLGQAPLEYRNGQLLSKS